PATTVRLGLVLDLVVKVDAGTLLRVDEWRDWAMVCGENGCELQPGRSKLFLFRQSDDEQARARDYSRAARAYERWHKREAKRVDVQDVPDELKHYQGRALRIGDRSGKWGARG